MRRFDILRSNPWHDSILIVGCYEFGRSMTATNFCNIGKF